VTAAPPWALVVPVKRLAAAKTRLALPAPVRAELALAFAVDTVTAALAAPGVRHVVVVTDDGRVTAATAAHAADVVADEPGAGLNAALAHGARRARSLMPTAGVAALSADLPALRPTELGRVLTAAAGHRLAYLVDLSGTGTTLLCARDPEEFGPAFGPDSAKAHAARGAVALPTTGVESVRLDVDTAADLDAACRLGVGTRTATAVAVLGLSSAPR
jgi:2-phospho-L-lactate guanylyltransferase